MGDIVTKAEGYALSRLIQLQAGEALQAQINSILLKSQALTDLDTEAQALTDLDTEARAKRMTLVALGEKPKVTA